MDSEKANVITEYHLNNHEPDKPQFAVYDMKDYLKGHHCSVSKPHIHSFYQIIWFQSGQGKHFVDFEVYDVFENAMFFIAPNQVHYFDENSDYEGILIHFNEPYLLPDASEFSFFLKCSLFNNPYQQPACCIGSGIKHQLEKYIGLIKEELEGALSFGKDELIRIYLMAFLVQTQRCKYEFEKRTGKPLFTVDEKRMQVIKFVNLINENYTKGLSIVEYAKFMSISSRTLSDLIGLVLNKTPLQMIQERIILEAKRLLLHSSLNVNQIGYRLGFDDPSYFVKYFRRQTGFSPTDFRKSIM
ncbi:AraC family transcriptional regulator [Chitinophaga pinensis]|uniref:Transcriptional regulator, AraC family n=1 Tax=Chitinophaga pinensis (strain ATCC 43595 / DSM 2588 / LMG 13176 / NBRC 15968 / NCIMB 11800 / UQM 2034) TaxID=485918 RepID=A0A979GVG3_CHIPD|nr:AraC family transcriptional regulator [Chitinophaga pinensis]ACU63393.1 transcriptional regulator, AraC family [Chitinophaga pinensis DSM 2588]